MNTDVINDVDFWKQLRRNAKSKQLDSIVLTILLAGMSQWLFWLLFANRNVDAGNIRQFIVVEVVLQVISIACVTLAALYIVGTRNSLIVYDELITKRPSPIQYVSGRTVFRNVLWTVLGVSIVVAADFIMMHTVNDYSIGGWLFLLLPTAVVGSFVYMLKTLEP